MRWKGFLAGLQYGVCLPLIFLEMISKAGAGDASDDILTGICIESLSYALSLEERREILWPRKNINS